MRILQAVAVVVVAGVMFAVLTTGQRKPLASGQSAPDFSAKGTDGKTHTLSSMTERGNAYFYFIKIGCPVNHRAAPFLKKISDAYGSKGNVVGVINGSVADAKAWAKEYGASFPIIADPDLKIIRAYGAQHSPWLVAVSKEGKVTKSWSEGSSNVLAEVNRLAANTAGMKVAQLSFTGAPSGGG